MRLTRLARLAQRASTSAQIASSSQLQQAQCTHTCPLLSSNPSQWVCLAPPNQLLGSFTDVMSSNSASSSSGSSSNSSAVHQQQCMHKPWQLGTAQLLQWQSALGITNGSSHHHQQQQQQQRVAGAVQMHGWGLPWPTSLPPPVHIQWPVWDAPPSSTPSSSSTPATWGVPEEQEQEGRRDGVPAPLLCIKRTYQPHTARRKKKHGFLKRLMTAGGRRVVRRRLSKGRHSLAV